MLCLWYVFCLGGFMVCLWFDYGLFMVWGVNVYGLLFFFGGGVMICL